MKRSKSDWEADWIWLDYITPAIINNPFRGLKEIGVLDSEKNRWGLFRKQFELPKDYVKGDENKSQNATLTISVDSRYKLYLNGQYVGRGIYRCNRFNWYYDEYDVSDFLKPGENVIAVIAQYFGKNLAWYETLVEGGLARATGSKGQLIFELSINSRGKSKVVAKSDKYVRGYILHAYEHTLKQAWIGLPYLEIFDAKRFPSDWNSVDFDDSDELWDHAKVLHMGNTWPQLVPCDIPRLEESRSYTDKIINAGKVETFFDDEDIKDSQLPGEEPIDFFMQHAFSPIDGTKTEEFDSGFDMTKENPELSFDINADKTIGLVLDLEKVMSGFLFFEFESSSDDVLLDIGWSERLDDSKERPFPHYKPYKMKYGMQYKGKKGLNAYEMFHWYGLRYVHLNFSTSDKAEIALKTVGMNKYLYPVESIGYFRCNDEKINKLVDACAWTLRNCMHDGYEDCPSREQRQWIGDAYVEIMVNYALFGDTALVKKLIRQVAQSQRGDGLTFMATPGDHEIHGVTIPDYCLYWIMIVYQYYEYTGDVDIIKEVYPVMIRAIRWFLSYLDEDTGLMTDIPYWIFIDWSQNDKWGMNGVLNCQLYHALKILLEMGQIIGWEGSLDEFKSYIKPIAQGINEYLWDEERGAYVDAAEIATNGDLSVRRSKKVSFHTNTLVLLYDIAPGNRIESIFKNVFEEDYSNMFVQNREPLWKDKTAFPLDEEKHVIIAEPFFMHHVNQAMGKYDRVDLIMRFVEDGWLQMLENGATTIWESWSNRASHCHAWSATPAYDLIRYVAGIKTDDMNENIVVIEPECACLEWVKAACPTRYGVLNVEWTWVVKTQHFRVKYRGPDEIQFQTIPPLISGYSVKSESTSERDGYKISDYEYEEEVQE